VASTLKAHLRYSILLCILESYTYLFVGSRWFSISRRTWYDINISLEAYSEWCTMLLSFLLLVGKGALAGYNDLIETLFPILRTMTSFTSLRVGGSTLERNRALGAHGGCKSAHG
jgi:hypothetical protein